MTTAALVPYNPDAVDPDVDSGYGLRFSSTGALVSVPWGRHCRGLSVTCQRILCALFNVVHTVRHDPWVRTRAGFGAAAVIVVVLLTVNPTLGFTVGLVCWAVLSWRLTRELTETREVAG